MDLLEKFQKTRECPKCEDSYFSMNIHWMDTYMKTVYTCDSCNWSFVVMSNCTSPSNAPDPSSPSPSKVSVQPVQSK